MTFSRVAAAILMFKGLDVAWSYGAIVSTRTEDATSVFVILTLGWLLLSFIVWCVLTKIGPLIARDSKDRSTATTRRRIQDEAERRASK